MNLDKIAIGKDPPFDVNVLIEIPQGGEPVKYEFDKESGALMVDRFLHTAMFYPGNYGFIPHTLAEDGDPCDVLVVGRDQIAHFFQHYKDLEKGKWVSIVRWIGPDECAELIRKGIARAASA